MFLNVALGPWNSHVNLFPDKSGQAKPFAPPLKLRRHAVVLEPLKHLSPDMLVSKEYGVIYAKISEIQRKLQKCTIFEPKIFYNSPLFFRNF